MNPASSHIRVTSVSTTTNLVLSFLTLPIGSNSKVAGSCSVDKHVCTALTFRCLKKKTKDICHTFCSYILYIHYVHTYCPYIFFIHFVQTFCPNILFIVHMGQFLQGGKNGRVTSFFSCPGQLNR